MSIIISSTHAMQSLWHHDYHRAETKLFFALAMRDSQQALELIKNGASIHAHKDMIISPLDQALYDPYLAKLILYLKGTSCVDWHNPWVQYTVSNQELLGLLTETTFIEDVLTQKEKEEFEQIKIQRSELQTSSSISKNHNHSKSLTLSKD